MASLRKISGPIVACGIGEMLILLLALFNLVSGDSQCIGTQSCRCWPGTVGGEYELVCSTSPSSEQDILIQILSKEYVKMQCTNQKTDFSLLQGLEIGPVKEVSMRFCPIPSSFNEVIGAMGLSSVERLYVKTYSKANYSLNREHLKGLTNLTKLEIVFSGITDLPEDLFVDVPNLTYLSFWDNKAQLPKGIFRSVPHLKVLELGSNNISSIEPGLFRNLTKLRLLNLWENRLQNLSRSIFSDLPMLESLDISSNRLASLPPDIFADLTSLKNLNILGNNFIALPQGLFLSTTQLKKFRLSRNRRTLKTLPPGLLSNLTQLEEVHLSSCNFSSLPGDLFHGSTGIRQIELGSNLLTELPEQIFADNKELSSLVLAHNLLESLPDQIFASLEKLTKLDLSHNRITRLSGDLFSNLRELTRLDLKYNMLNRIHTLAFQGAIALEYIDLSHNQLSDLSVGKGFADRQSVFHRNVKLKTILLSHNNLSEIYDDWLISKTNLETLNLNHNSLTKLSINDVSFISSRVTVDLEHNQISFIDFQVEERQALDFQTSVVRGSENTVTLLLKSNPFICDCHIFHLVKFLRGELSPSLGYKVEIDDSDLTCSGPEEMKDTTLRTVEPKALTCEVTEECPRGCKCFVRPADLGLLIHCSAHHQSKVPDSLPFRRYLSLPDGSYQETNQTHIDLSRNHIKTLPARFGPGYDRVTRLILSNNNITFVNVTTLPPILQVLELDGNNLTGLDAASTRYLMEAPKLQKLTLMNNPWQCGCETKDLITFVQSNYKKIPDLGAIKCIGGALMSQLTISELCPVSGMAWGIALIVAFLGLFIGALAALYYRYQKAIKVWLYAHRMCLWFVTEEELDKDKVYDAFISYSQKDEDFVVNKLVPELENGPTKFKLCLHYRDWVVGDFIPTQIARSVEESRRTVVVLSPNFIESIWGRMEFRAAHSQALSEGRARVIVLLYGDIGPTESLDPELKAYLSMNTYVKWGDPWFWDKLRYALPHPPEFSKGIPLISRNGSCKRSDKSNLVNGTDNGVTPAIIDPLTTLNSKPV